MPQGPDDPNLEHTETLSKTQEVVASVLKSPSNQEVQTEPSSEHAVHTHLAEMVPDNARMFLAQLTEERWALSSTNTYVHLMTKQLQPFMILASRQALSY